jgi:hypothetical protein
MMRRNACTNITTTGTINFSDATPTKCLLFLALISHYYYSNHLQGYSSYHDETTTTTTTSIQSHPNIFSTFFNIGVVCNAEEFNTQIMARVRERIDEFMRVPVETCQRLSRYRQLHGFTYNMTSSDHQAILTTLYTEAPTSTLYFGLEDGTFFYMYENLKWNEYREPGNDGYITDNIEYSK